MKAVIMSGGEGSRLRPLTCDLPKPMVPIINTPVMQFIIELLKTHNIEQIAVTLMFLPQKIKDYFSTGKKFGVNLKYFTEDVPLGTAGSIKNAESFLDETFVVISGDSITNVNLSEAIAFHKAKKAKVTIVLARVSFPLEYGVVISDSSGKVTGFIEKPSWNEVLSDTVNTGIYIIEPDVLKYIDKNRSFDFSRDLFPLLLSNNEPIYGYVMPDYWYDIGDINAYMQVHLDILQGKIPLKTDYEEIKEGIWTGPGTTIDPEAKIFPPCIIGSNCLIEKNAVIDDSCILGDNNVIEENVSLRRSILWNNNYIEYGSEIRGATLCNKINIKQFVSVFENVVIADKCIINERAIIKPNVKIWPQKVVESFSILDRSIIWGSKHYKSIFGGSGLSGIINVDISPEFATRLGAAYGSLFKKGAKIIVGSTNSNSARMFKHAFVSGILSVGIEVFNLSNLLTPIARHAVNFLSAEGAIHIKISNANPNKLLVDFMDPRGLNISKSFERRIENVFFKEDFKRCSGNEINKLNTITDFDSYYTRYILSEIDTELTKAKALKICIVSPSDFVNSLAISMLTDIGCKVISFFSTALAVINPVVEEINKNDADFAAFIDNNGEELILIDKFGNIIKDSLFTIFISLIILKTQPQPKVIVPVTIPTVIDNLAKKFNGEIIRTKTYKKAIMGKIMESVSDESNRKNQIILNFDAIASLIKIVEFLSKHNTSLPEIMNEIPEFFIDYTEVHCPWELKGKVMRRLLTEHNESMVELFDGVKFIFDYGWALVLPDNDMPLFKIYSEGTTKKTASKIINEYTEKINEIITQS